MIHCTDMSGDICLSNISFVPLTINFAPNYDVFTTSGTCRIGISTYAAILETAEEKITFKLMLLIWVKTSTLSRSLETLS